ncbi:MAG: flavodoxin family protein [Oscillibacter sp.]|nr:flavodoxin family protein [Oscillibacter sp.]
MGKKILILAGSPRKGGNSDILCDEFARGAEETGHQVQKIYVHTLHIGGCMACYACRSTGVCVQKDGMAEALEALITADVIVLATPVYFYSMDGQLKTLIDRTLPRYTEIQDKDFYFIATAAAGKRAMERTMDALRGFTDCLPGAKCKGQIYGSGVYQKGEVRDTPAMAEAYQAGKHA